MGMFDFYAGCKENREPLSCLLGQRHVLLTYLGFFFFYFNMNLSQISHIWNILNLIRGFGIYSGWSVLVLSPHSGVNVTLGLGFMSYLPQMWFLLLYVEPGHPEVCLRCGSDGHHMRAVGQLLSLFWVSLASLHARGRELFGLTTQGVGWGWPAVRHAWFWEWSWFNLVLSYVAFLSLEELGPY